MKLCYFLFDVLIIFSFPFPHCFPFLKAFITNSQWKTINSLLTTNKLTGSQKSQLGKIIYIHYENWAYYQSYKFKMFHVYKCRKIKQRELNLYASIGLSKAIAHYNPLKCKNTTTFSSYAIHYIMSELRDGLTELQTINILTTCDKIKSKSESKNKNSKEYNYNKIANDVILVGDNDYLLDSKRNPNYNEYLQYETLWNNIYNMNIPSFVKKIIILKNSFEFKQLLSNKKIAEILGCSEEWVRQNINNYKSKIVIQSHHPPL